MLNKNLLKIIDDEVESYYKIYLKYLNFANNCTIVFANDEVLKTQYSEKIKEYYHVYLALLDLREKICREIGS